jgi:hypothetical protein
MPREPHILLTAGEDCELRAWNLAEQYTEHPCAAIFAGEGDKDTIYAGVVANRRLYSSSYSFIAGRPPKREVLHLRRCLRNCQLGLTSISQDISTLIADYTFISGLFQMT